MRELAKSMLSFTWAMPLLGLEEMVDMAMPRDMSRPFGKATAHLDAVTTAAKAQLEGPLQGAFQAGDRLGRGVLEAAFAAVPLDAMSPAAMLQTASRVMQWSLQAMGRAMPGAQGRG